MDGYKLDFIASKINSLLTKIDTLKIDDLIDIYTNVQDGDGLPTSSAIKAYITQVNTQLDIDLKTYMSDQITNALGNASIEISTDPNNALTKKANGFFVEDLSNAIINLGSNLSILANKFNDYDTSTDVDDKISNALSGYTPSDLTDYAKKTEVTQEISDALNDYLTKTDLNSKGFITDSDLITKLSNYYNKTEIDSKLPDLTNYYNKTEVYPKADVYTKTEVDGLIPSSYTKTELDTKLNDYYKKTEVYDKASVYTKTEVDNLLSGTSGTGSGSGSGGSSITLDASMSDTSENGVQNKIVKKYIDDKDKNTNDKIDNFISGLKISLAKESDIDAMFVTV